VLFPTEARVLHASRIIAAAGQAMFTPVAGKPLLR